MLGLVFPGQGSQSVGMGKDFYDNFPEARLVFSEVDDALDFSLSRIIFDGPIEELTLTSNAQPALMAVSISILRSMESRGFDIKSASYLAGHSLGEYSALCAGGSLSVTDTARLLRLRGESMQSAVPVGAGAMAAIIGLDSSIIEEICSSVDKDDSTVCEVANDNGGDQWVISGHTSSVRSAMDLAQERGAKRCIELPVSAPFHCRLMSPAASTMRDALSSTKINAPLVSVVSNVMASPVSSDEIGHRLIEQVTGRVRWRESIEFMSSSGVDRIVEVGSGKVLSGLARRIDRDIETLSLSTISDLDLFMEG